MDQPTPVPQPMLGTLPGAAQIAYVAPPYPPPMASGPSGVIGAIPSQMQPPPGSSPFPTAQHQFNYQQIQQFHQQQQHQHLQQLRAFWANQMQEIEHTTDFKNHSLPLARIKKIMKADEDVRMISAEAPVIFGKACEMFILELTLRSWMHTEENKRRTLQKNDIAAAITRTDIFDFLVDIVPRDELKEDGIGIARAALPGMGAPADSISYYYVPAQPQFAAGSGMIMGKPDDQMAGITPQDHPMAYVWQQPPLSPNPAPAPAADPDGS